MPATQTDLIFLSLNARVIALSKSNGEIRWTTPLPGMVGDRFVTLNADGERVYAFARGQLHCLDQSTGRILWTNELKGYGYGIASLCIPGFLTAPDPAVYAKHRANEDSHHAGNPTPAT